MEKRERFESVRGVERWEERDWVREKVTVRVGEEVRETRGGESGEEGGGARATEVEEEHGSCHQSQGGAGGNQNGSEQPNK